ncbi:MAG: 1-deoxy-D-xylulose-5-phosphate synthase [Candidatus Omnitrophica bacterium]|nr:1-deoxy-D-xylulose-5-phosphate synthase [Candidatus Omnitrophota bacterium]
MLLEKINSPLDLKKLNIEQLPQLASEIRSRIIEVVSRTGGHLASSLGAVELTIALHYCLNAPYDKIIWDVGHQTYAHKILTGRNKDFDRLRQAGGLSAFLSKDESLYDVFTTGHSSSAVSLALGLVAGQRINPQDEPFKVVAVIGDGALSGGLCFEGLNNAGHLNEDLIVILNTNELSIAPNVGALSNYLNKIISLPIYNRFRESLENFVKTRLPKGSRLLKLANKFEEGLKGLFVPGIFFEELGFRYFGPFDGHNCEILISAFRNIFSLKGPRLIHVVTKKGKGYLPAEKEPIKFHSSPPFEIASGQMKKTDAPTYTDIFSNKLLALAEKNQWIVAITAAMPEGTGLDKFRDKYPERFFDVGIAEAHAVCFAAGLAKAGLRPVVAIYSTFLQRAYDQLIEEVALQELPVVICLDRAGLVSADGPTHQGIFDLGYLGQVPHLVVMAPADQEELEMMLEFALELNQPAALRYPKDKARDLPFKKDILSLGVPQVLKKGKDAALIALGSMVEPSLEASEILAKQGIDLTVINSRFVKPLEKKMFLALIQDTPCVFSIEEGLVRGGFGSTLAQLLQTKIINLGLPEDFPSTASRQELLSRYGLDSQGIAQKIKLYLKEKVYA